ncbi:hypothetical protein CEXT_451411 [Caerostris extrusa]|uniref:Uncharacterized protein n=1 Tax=Caerostris extrusa TaxID=172846 RepID=A0AAV4Y9L2_CAEEX|nr:hypothetical protein CEXT_451411 [Caerostris extrusa]
MKKSPPAIDFDSLIKNSVSANKVNSIPLKKTSPNILEKTKYNEEEGVKHPSNVESIIIPPKRKRGRPPRLAEKPKIYESEAEKQPNLKNKISQRSNKLVANIKRVQIENRNENQVNQSENQVNQSEEQVNQSKEQVNQNEEQVKSDEQVNQNENKNLTNLIQHNVEEQKHKFASKSSIAEESLVTSSQKITASTVQEMTSSPLQCSESVIQTQDISISDPPESISSHVEQPNNISKSYPKTSDIESLNASKYEDKSLSETSSPVVIKRPRGRPRKVILQYLVRQIHWHLHLLYHLPI